jgi:hypothetical protein
MNMITAVVLMELIRIEGIFLQSRSRYRNRPTMALYRTPTIAASVGVNMPL